MEYLSEVPCASHCIYKRANANTSTSLISIGVDVSGGGGGGGGGGCGGGRGTPLLGNEQVRQVLEAVVG